MHTLIKILKDFKPREVFALVLLITLLVTSTILLAIRIQYINELALTNQGYVRYMACVMDVKNETRSDSVSNKISDACWQRAEIETGMDLKRYSEKILLENLERK